MDTTQQKNKASKTKVFVVIGLIIVLLLSVLGWFGYGYFASQQLVKSVPSNIRSDVSFAIYMPTLDTLKPIDGSFTYSAGILQFNAGQSSIVNISQQEKTKGFDLAKFGTSENLIGSQQLQLPYGNAITGEIAGRNIAIIETEETIITITSDTDQVIKTVLDSLKKI